MNMTRCSGLPTSLILVVLGLSGAYGQWVTVATDTLAGDTNRRWLSMQAIAADSNGNLHAAWTEQVTVQFRRLMYDYCPADSAWRRAELVAESTNNQYGLAVEPSTGVAHLAWTVQTGSHNDVMYADNRSGQWQTTRLTQDSLTDWQPSIALDRQSSVHIAWVVEDSNDEYHIVYASNNSGSWRSQVLHGSQLGGYGLGAQPWLAVAPNGAVHVTYRGGDYPEYHVLHAQNTSPSDTIWYYEVLHTDNPADYSSGICAADSGELYAVVSGNEGWGMPFHTYFLHRPPNAGQWDPAELMTASASASLRGFAQDGEFTHCTWERINGNINGEEIYHCSNIRGFFYNSPIRADGITSAGALAIDSRHRGYALVLVAPGDSQYLCCVRSEPLTDIAEPGVEPARLSPITATLSCGRVLLQATGTVRIYNASGRLVLQSTICNRQSEIGNRKSDVSLDLRHLPPGIYLALSSGMTVRFLLMR